MPTPSDLSQSAKCFCFDWDTAKKIVIYLLASQAHLLSMTPSQLSSAAKNYSYDDDTWKKVAAFLLATQAGLSGDTPNQLSVLAKCYCFDDETWKKVVVYLLNAGGGGTCPQDMQVAWTPTNLKLGEELGFFTFGDIPGITSITFNQVTSVAGFDVESTTQITNLSWPNLVSVDPSSTQNGYIFLTANTALTSISLPLLVTVGGTLSIFSNPAIASVSLPSLTTVHTDMNMLSNAALTSWSAPILSHVGGNLQASGCPVLVTVTLSAFLPTQNSNVDFSGCALSAASVNHILARAVANAGYTNGTVGVSGGTSAAPSGQGLVDRGILIGRGVVVNTN